MRVLPNFKVETRVTQIRLRDRKTGRAENVYILLH